MRMLGFDGGATGNYAQGMITISGTSLLLDPTIGMVVKIGFDDLLSSRRCGAEFRDCLYARRPGHHRRHEENFQFCL